MPNWMGEVMLKNVEFLIIEDALSCTLCTTIIILQESRVNLNWQSAPKYFESVFC